MEQTLDVPSLIGRAGGAEAVSLESVRLAKRNPDRKTISIKGVYAWNGNGIPNWHWDMIMAMTGCSEADIYAANQRSRERSHSSAHRHKVQQVA